MLQPATVDAVRRFWAHHPPTTSILSVVELGDQTYVLAPGHLRERIRGTDVDSLLHVAGPGARLHGVADLAYTDVIGTAPDVATIDDADPRIDALERACKRAEWLEASMDEPMTQRFAVLDDDQRTIVACAGYRTWSDVIGQQCVLTHPGQRRRGLAPRVATASTAAAIDAGLISQWRSEIGNVASKRLGERLGYVALGRQTTVRLRTR